MKALVVIPTYNEAESVVGVLDQVLAADPRVDVLIVDDGS
ncbi:MAG TPA: glycosyltransferase, partial [Actinomycetes bacterium]